jgi:hypothetical protein
MISSFFLAFREGLEAAISNRYYSYSINEDRS